MKMKHPLNISKTEIESACRKWNISRLSIFGSALRPDFSESSDVDLLVSIENSQQGLFALGKMRDEFVTIFGREVDLITEDGLREMRNPIRRNEILSTCRPIYVA
jgi:predicted nucleotidyltransferase